MAKLMRSLVWRINPRPRQSELHNRTHSLLSLKASNRRSSTQEHRSTAASGRPFFKYATIASPTSTGKGKWDQLPPLPRTVMRPTVQTLLLKLVRQGDTSLRMQDITLALLQDTMAEARAGRKASCEQEVATLKEGGLNSSQIAKRFEAETAEAKDFAYGAAPGT